jgi:hypothetical protein
MTVNGVQCHEINAEFHEYLAVRFASCYSRHSLDTRHVLCIVAATRNHVAKSFPNTSSESDLQRYRAVWDRSSRERKSPSLSNVASDRHKVCMLSWHLWRAFAMQLQIADS